MGCSIDKKGTKMAAKNTLEALRKRRGFTHAQLAAECRKRPGGELIGTTNLCAYLSGKRSIGDVHFQLLCEILRVKSEDVQTIRFLARSPGKKAESVAENE